MAFQLIPVNGSLHVEGQSDAEDVGEFRGQALAIGLRDTDPVSAVNPETESSGASEGLFGWGTTYFLVADPDKPRPVWVSKSEIQKHRFDDQPP